VRPADAATVAHRARAGQGEGAKELSERRGNDKAKIAAVQRVFIDSVFGRWPAVSLSSPTAQRGIEVVRGGQLLKKIHTKVELTADG
jgi:hypothetical protein